MTCEWGICRCAFSRTKSRHLIGTTAAAAVHDDDEYLPGSLGLLGHPNLNFGSPSQDACSFEKATTACGSRNDQTAGEADESEISNERNLPSGFTAHRRRSVTSRLGTDDFLGGHNQETYETFGILTPSLGGSRFPGITSGPNSGMQTSARFAGNPQDNDALSSSSFAGNEDPTPNDTGAQESGTRFPSSSQGHQSPFPEPTSRFATFTTTIRPTHIHETVPNTASHLHPSMPILDAYNETLRKANGMHEQYVMNIRDLAAKVTALEARDAERQAAFNAQQNGIETQAQSLRLLQAEVSQLRRAARSGRRT